MHGNLMASKRKKNRLVTAREPAGRISRSEGEREYSPTQVRRLRDAAMRGLRDEEWGTELGRYYLETAITSEMYAAGKWWAELASRYAEAINSPGQPKAIQLERGSLGKPPDPDTEKGKDKVSRDCATVLAFEEAKAVLGEASGMAEKVVRNLCEHNVSPTGHFELYCLRRGLDMLAKWRNLTNGSKSRSHGR